MTTMSRKQLNSMGRKELIAMLGPSMLSSTTSGMGIEELRHEVAIRSTVTEDMTDSMSRTEENSLYLEYRKGAEAVKPPVAILSFQGWRDEGRPTAQQFHSFYNQPTPGEIRTNQEVNNKMSATETTATDAKAPRAKSTKTLIRELFANEKAAYTLEEIEQATGKQKGAVTTAISDLKSEKYCKPGEPLSLHRWTSDNKYRLTAEPESAKPAKVAPASKTSEQTTQASIPATGTASQDKGLVLENQQPTEQTVVKEEALDIS